MVSAHMPPPSAHVLHLCMEFAVFYAFAPLTHPLLKARYGKDEFFHCGEDSVTGAKIDTWLGCHGYLLPIASFASRLICCMALTLQ